MYRGLLLAVSLAAMVLPARADTVWELVTPAEVQLELATPHPAGPQTRAMPAPGAPKIVVVQPVAAGTLHPPLTFRVRFVPEAGAAIDTHTFRATYGFMGIDITSRLLQHARLSSQELDADNVAVPAGNHQVTLTIADSRGREVSQTFQFTVQ